MSTNVLGELLDACDAVVSLHQRVTAQLAAENVVAHATLQAPLDQLAVAVRRVRRQRDASGDPGE